MTPSAIVAYLVLFATVGAVFVFASLLIGRLVRPRVPTAEKMETYECGEPTIGSSFVQFDLRFYVVALVFIIFDVEVAFFFPWAVVYGKATQLLNPEAAVVVAAPAASTPGSPAVALTPAAAQSFEDLGVRKPEVPLPTGSVQANQEKIEDAARRLARVAMLDMAVFFGVLLVGFAYVWRRGDLDWVRAIRTQAEEAVAHDEALPATPSQPAGAPH